MERLGILMSADTAPADDLMDPDSALSLSSSSCLEAHALLHQVIRHAVKHRLDRSHAVPIQVAHRNSVVVAGNQGHPMELKCLHILQQWQWPWFVDALN